MEVIDHSNASTFTSATTLPTDLAHTAGIPDQISFLRKGSQIVHDVLPFIAFYTSRALLDEFARVLTRTKLARAIRATGKTSAQLVAEYQGFVNVVTPASVRRTVPGDPDDDRVLACALAAQADLIVSGDAHLLDLKSYQRIPILTATAALAIIAGA